MPNWDTYDARGGGTARVVFQALSFLVRLKSTSLSELEGDAAESWAAGGDGTTFTFRLRRGIQWTDGRPLTSADVAYNLNRASDPKYTYNKVRVSKIASVQAPDSFTLTITLKGPSASFLQGIGVPSMLLYPAHVPDLEAWQRSPVTSGPFKFKEFKAQSTWGWDRNLNYFGRDAAGRRLPFLDAVVYTWIADTALGLAAFRSGRLHCGCLPDDSPLFTNIDQLAKETPALKTGDYLGAAQALQFNLQRPPFNNASFRQGLAIGLDKENIASVYRQGKTHRPAPPLIPPERGGQWGLPREELTKLQGYSPDHSRDLTIARQKFRESGIDPKDVPMTVMTTVFFGDAVEIVVTALNELGIKAKSLIVPPGDSVQRLLRGDFDTQLLIFFPSIDDPGDQYVDFLLKDGVQNYGKWTNDRADQLLREQESVLDPVRRRAMLWEVQRIQLTDYPSAPYLYLLATTGRRPEVNGYPVAPLAVHPGWRLDTAWLEK